MNRINSNSLSIFAITALFALFIAGCATPDYNTTSSRDVISPDASDNLGGTGIESTDVRTIATRMSGSLLSIPEISFADHPVRIAIQPIKNSTRFMIDNEIFTTRLRAELNSISQGRVRFYAQNLAQETRVEIMLERNRNRWDEQVGIGSEKLLQVVQQQGLGRAANIAVLDSTNTNLSQYENANSVLSLVRSRMAQEPGLVRFLSREGSGKVIDAVRAEADARDMGLVEGPAGVSSAGADYFLGGDMIAKELQETDEPSGDFSNKSIVLNLQLIDAKSGVVLGEFPIPLSERLTRGIENATYILSGEMRGISKAAYGDRSDYILLSFQLIDPINNELVWEDIYETKKVSNNSVLYK